MWQNETVAFWGWAKNSVCGPLNAHKKSANEDLTCTLVNFTPVFVWDPVGLLQLVPLQFCIEGLAIDFEDSGGLALVTFHQFQYLLDMGLFDNPERLY